MLKEKAISDFFHGKSAIGLLAVAAVLCTLLAWQRGAVTPLEGNLGIGLPSANLWMAFSPASALVNLAVCIGIALLFVYIIRAFNILRSLSAMGGTMFLAIQIALPTVAGQFFGGTLLALVALICIALLFSVFGENRGQIPVYTLFLLLSAATFTQLPFAFYMPVFLLGCVQMRIFSPRTLLAALLGIITPPWILFGFGIVDPRTVALPQFTVVWELAPSAEIIRAMVVIGITASLGIIFAIVNLMKILSYNSRVRAYNGFLTMMLIFTALFIPVYFSDFTFFVPLLNCLVAYQICHFFTYRRKKRSYIPVLLIIALFLALYAWAVFL